MKHAHIYLFLNSVAGYKMVEIVTNLQVIQIQVMIFITGNK